MKLPKSTMVISQQENRTKLELEQKNNILKYQ